MTASLAMGRVALVVHDLNRVADFYETVVGLRRLGIDGETAQLGTGTVPLLELRQDRAARRHGPDEAGLYHTAFLLPDRGSLGRWIRYAEEGGVTLRGAADHLVSEAVYLTDPEGNGIEIYADRPSNLWTHKDGHVVMANDRLDFPGLLADAGSTAWDGVPEGSRIGHVHLQVGGIAEAEAFYAGLLGLDITCRFPSASFYSADGYHHHMAANIWNSRGVSRRNGSATGLAEVQIQMNAARLNAAAARTGQTPVGGRLVLQDPWGTSISLVAL